MNTYLEPTTQPEGTITRFASPELDFAPAPNMPGGDKKWMRAVYLKQQGGAESLILGEVQRPVPQAGEVLVKVHATAITPTEFQWYPTLHTLKGEPRPFPIVLGHEFSGVVKALGPGVKGFQVGDEVFGLNDWFSNGAQAEYCVAPSSSLALKPRLIDHMHAAVVPISALTAWQGLMEKARLQSGQRVLIHGAAGGVGMFAVQLARWRGAHVIATASTGNLDYVRALGAHEALDYRTTRWEQSRDIDVVFDAVGGKTLDRSWPLLSPGGQVVTIATPSASATEQRVRDAFMLVRADGSQLRQISHWIDDGELLVFVADTFPLDQTREAYARAEQGRMRGKVALKVCG